MTNPNYISGRAFEYQVKKALEDDDYTVMRTAGSHGPFDLIAVKDGHVTFIQCKVVTKASQYDTILKKFRQAPPLVLGHYVQQIAIKIKGTRQYALHDL